MRGVYAVSTDNATVTDSTNHPTLVWINAVTSGVAGCGLEIIRAWIDFRGNATSAQCGARLSTQVTTFPTVTGQTPRKINPGDAVSQVVSGTGTAGTAGHNSSADGTGTVVSPVVSNFNHLNGFLWVATPNEVFTLTAGSTSGFGVAFGSTPATLAGWSGGLIYRET